MSAVTDMNYMFFGASAFNKDLSKWDVSAVTSMRLMFAYASAFNQDMSMWDVSAVTEMNNMFDGAKAFKRELCGAAWLNSKADKTEMFKDSPGSISSTVCKKARTGYCKGVRYGQG